MEKKEEEKEEDGMNRNIMSVLPQELAEL